MALFSPRRLPVFFKESHSDSRTWIRNRTRESYTSVVAERTTCTLTCTHNPPLPPNFPPNLTNTHLPACVSRKLFHIFRITPLCIIRKLKLHSREAYIRELLIREPLRDDRPSANISPSTLYTRSLFFFSPFPSFLDCALSPSIVSRELRHISGVASPLPSSLCAKVCHVQCKCG